LSLILERTTRQELPQNRCRRDFVVGELIEIRKKLQEHPRLRIFRGAFTDVFEDGAGVLLDDTKFNEIGSPDGNYDIVQTKTDLPVRFTPADRKLYYVIDQGVFYLWNGTEWEKQSISDDDIDALFI
jgi:hypothetical protein